MCDAERIRQLSEELRRERARLARITGEVFNADEKKRKGIVEGLKEIWQNDAPTELQSQNHQ